MLCTLGMKVLVVDRNNYYGGESASLNLTNLHEKFRGSQPSAAVNRSLGAPEEARGSLPVSFFTFYISLSRSLPLFFPM